MKGRLGLSAAALGQEAEVSRLFGNKIEKESEICRKFKVPHLVIFVLP